MRQIAAQAAGATANSQVLAIMCAQYRAQAQMRAAQTMQNITGNMGNSPYQYQIRYK